ncbi:bifunctional 23S rRNA (guanine(2069)-N(7))-methyltransferase RlmK/23S rRNA (guanine(2445)-N(2))-methyltransferase RlmL [Sansalvadorimonas sp. 2012CJ34-2]|uniref:Ribosomal RNA large subunit methyltransferase K/L n=1 Tax=Parendozoicomonas callyspongiae TaxID=2942213 RepID=A0ABT0PEQ1_9GAMM|nr:bifunctional 23S rRNA (guanine(2069)-N(7))-methyltransferase RlmK/23S rRNA (guanine(2445)-N(2))-methyltransferase RlmL [Sansalvadorimonas sp. 2012CJ34-2]MCL6269785.1 bifunctional 23S rRNA (guanine(2069)-N(7))-methyltransferase RlmK/23S rRNA (guanine(2445)-N(2))-methyltransferase RlmL [Sansalvadorimonas sp. 2012CJ34-2]
MHGFLFVTVSMYAKLDLFASCPKGVEGLLAEELASLGGEEIRQTVAGCSFKGTLQTAYRCCLWSRLANRILLPLRQVDAQEREMLYDGVKAIPWEDHFEPNATMAVAFSGTSGAIKNTHFGALVVKDGVCDRLRDKSGFRPNISKKTPDVRIHVRLNRNRADISLDLSGESLHRRGYRIDTGKAPLKENLAAALLIRAGWPQMCKTGMPLVDPLCGSGTLLLEGAMMAADIAPGLLRLNYGFHKWSGHIPKLWLDLLEEARERRKAGLAKLSNSFIGYEGDVRVVRQAHENLRRAGLEKIIHIETRELANVEPIKSKQGLVISNPPYGERLGEESSLVWLYQHLGETLRTCFHQWQGAVITSNQGLARRMGLRARKNYSFYNGALETKLFLFDIQPEWYFGAHKKAQEAEGQQEQQDSPDSSSEKSTAEVAGQVSLGKGAEMFANRLRKNLKQLQKWARKEKIECYRAYDADMPEYAVAIDLYRDKVLVQEYKAPASIDEQKAQERLHDVLQAIPSVLPVKPDQVFLKQRSRQSGKSQYRRLASEKQHFEVLEGGCKFLVNLADYLDTGLFLDHRPMRLRIQKEAAGKRFLNLFCYTGAATVHAAAGGASQTTSVDLSRTYLEWARQNLSLNGFSDRHQLVNADCMKWLKESRETFDLIFIDPPTFSNSKKMRDVFDIQAVHGELLERAMSRLAKDGVLYFSNNFRKFKLDGQLTEKFTVEEISGQTIDRDFKRNQKIHRCWKLTHRV